MKTFLCLLTAVVGSISAIAAPSTSMFLTSNDFSNGGTIPPRFTCEGANDSPSLRIAMPPTNTKSLVLIMDDPDAPKGTFTHWLVWGISPETTEFNTDSVPTGVVQGTNDGGKVGYMGPCPPSGQHRFYFRLYALDIPVKLPAGARRAQVDAAIKGHVLAEATLLGRFGRSTSAPTP
ncbi:YbhB/YbcL family Raf kinase inhibitor-like protein [Verrucomicrobiota bacterium sgz303538]